MLGRPAEIGQGYVRWATAPRKGEGSIKWLLKVRTGNAEFADDHVT
jgi:hypothetical protein